VGGVYSGYAVEICMAVTVESFSQLIRPWLRLLVIKPMTEPMDDSTQADKNS